MTHGPEMIKENMPPELHERPVFKEFPNCLTCGLYRSGHLGTELFCPENRPMERPTPENATTFKASEYCQICRFKRKSHLENERCPIPDAPSPRHFWDTHTGSWEMLGSAPPDRAAPPTSAATNSPTTEDSWVLSELVWNSDKQRWVRPEDVPPTPLPVDVGPRPPNTAAPADQLRPSYYGGAGATYEVIKVIDAWQLDFYLGSVLKYVARCGKKTVDPLEDLYKARTYLDMKIARLEHGT